MTTCDACPLLAELMAARVREQRARVREQPAREHASALQHRLTSAQNLLEQHDRDRAHLHPFRQEET